MSGRSVTWLRCCLVIFAVISALCVSGPALYFKFKKGWKLEGVSASCTPCSCHCAHPQSLLQIVPVCKAEILFKYSSSCKIEADHCGKDDPDLKEEMEKQFVDLLSEELKLQETVGKEHSHHMNISLREAGKLASQYQREAEKCNAATETCEGARERAETLLIKEKRISLLWERRAKLLGWE